MLPLLLETVLPQETTDIEKEAHSWAQSKIQMVVLA